MEWIWIQLHGVGWKWGWKSGPWRPLCTSPSEWGRGDIKWGRGGDMATPHLGKIGPWWAWMAIGTACHFTSCVKKSGSMLIKIARLTGNCLKLGILKTTCDLHVLLFIYTPLNNCSQIPTAPCKYLHGWKISSQTPLIQHCSSPVQSPSHDCSDSLVSLHEESSPGLSLVLTHDEDESEKSRSIMPVSTTTFALCNVHGNLYRGRRGKMLMFSFTPIYIPKYEQ